MTIRLGDQISGVLPDPNVFLTIHSKTKDGFHVIHNTVPIFLWKSQVVRGSRKPVGDIQYWRLDPNKPIVKKILWKVVANTAGLSCTYRVWASTVEQARRSVVGIVAKDTNITITRSAALLKSCLTITPERTK